MGQAALEQQLASPLAKCSLPDRWLERDSRILNETHEQDRENVRVLGRVLKMKSYVLQLQWGSARNKNQPQEVGLGAYGRRNHDGLVPYETPHHGTLPQQPWGG